MIMMGALPSDVYNVSVNTPCTAFILCRSHYLFVPFWVPWFFPYLSVWGLFSQTARAIGRGAGTGSIRTAVTHCATPRWVEGGLGRALGGGPVGGRGGV